MMDINHNRWASGPVFLLLAAVILSACSTGTDEQEFIDRAKGYLETRDLNAATLELKNVLLENAKNAEARYLLGRIYLNLGDAKTAEKELIRALDAGWDEAAVQLSLAEAYLRQGEFQKVLDNIPLKDIYPDVIRAELLGIRASAEAGLGKLDKAAETLSTGESISPDAFWVLQSSIMLQVNSGDWLAAEKALAQALQVYPSSQDVWLLKAGSAEAKGDHSETVAALQKVIDLEPPHNMTATGRRARLAQSQALLKEQDYTKAQAVIDPILATYPSDPLANYQTGLIAFRQGQHDLTEERLLKVLKVAPEHRQTLLLFGTLNYVRNDFQQAAYYLEKSVAIQPADIDTQILLGRTYLMLGQYDEAEDRFKMASSMAGENAELKALVGISKLKGGDARSGLKDLETAAETAPDDVSVRSALAKAYLNTGDTQRAINMLESALEESDEQHQTKALLILAYLRSSEYDKAAELAHKLSEQLPDNAMPYLAVGMASEGKKDYVMARRSYDKVLSLKPDDISALLGHARLDMNEGSSQGARERYQAVLALQPDHTEALVSFAYLMDREGNIEEAIELLEKARTAGPELLEPRLILSNFYLKRGDAREALVYAREAQKIDSRDRRVLLILGKAQLGVADPGAKQTFMELAEQVPGFPDSHYYLAIAKARSGDLEGARNSLQNALKLKPDHIQARFALGNLELKSGNTETALEIARQLQKSNSDLANGYLLEGDVLMFRKETKGALSVYQSALARAQDGTAVIRVSQAQKKLGNLEASYDALSAWLQTHPDDLTVRLALAMTYMADGQNDAARSQFRMVLEKQPENPTVLNDLAWLTHEAGEPGAVEMAERAHRLAPDNPAIQDTYGWLLVQNGRLESGLIALEQAAKKAPDIYDIRYHLAVALAKVGEKSRAKQELKSILEPGKPFPERDKAEALLKELQS